MIPILTWWQPDFKSKNKKIILFQRLHCQTQILILSFVSTKTGWDSHITNVPYTKIYWKIRSHNMDTFHCLINDTVTGTSNAFSDPLWRSELFYASDLLALVQSYVYICKVPSCSLVLPGSERLLWINHSIITSVTGVCFFLGILQLCLSVTKPIPVCRSGIGLQNLCEWFWFHI